MVLDDWTSRVEWEIWTSGICPLEAGVLEKRYALSLGLSLCLNVGFWA